jgi:hypothetical protein
MREETHVGARNQELEELQRRIEELEHRRDGDVATNSNSKAKSEIEQNIEDVYPAERLISYLSNKGSTKVKVSCYDGILKDETLIDSIGELERYFEYENLHDPNRV